MASRARSNKSATGSASSNVSKMLSHSPTPCKSDEPVETLENEETSENRGLERKADDLAPPSNEIDETCMFVELPGDLFSLVLLYLLHKDRLSVAVLCKDSLNKVEPFSEQKWRELLPMMADDTFEARIHDQSSIQGENPKPLFLPHRYLLWKAHRTHLYSLGAPKEDGRVMMELMSLDILPDASIMACWIDNRQVDHDVSLKWDLSTRQLIARTELGRQEEDSYSVQVYEEFIVVEYFNSFGVFTLDGKLLHHIDAAGGVVKKITVDQKGVFFISSLANQDVDSLSCLDLATGKLKRNLVKYQGQTRYSMIVMRNTLLVRRNNEAGNLHVTANNGIYVYGIDEEHLQEKQHVSGGYSSLAQASDDPTIIVAAGTLNGRIEIFKFKNGTLSRTAAVVIQNFLQTAHFPCVLHVTKSRVVLRKDRDVLVYSLLNGQLLRSFGPPGQSLGRVVTTNGCHLLVGYDSRYADGDISVKAYCLDGY